MSTQRHCHTCQRKTLHVKDSANHGCLTHVLLTIVTLGLWIPFAVLSVGLSSVSNTFGSFRCQTCGAKSGAGRGTSLPVRLVCIAIYAAAAYWFFVIRDTTP